MVIKALVSHIFIIFIIAQSPGKYNSNGKVWYSEETSAVAGKDEMPHSKANADCFGMGHFGVDGKLRFILHQCVSTQHGRVKLIR